MAKSKTVLIKHITIYSVYLLLAWALYRFLFRLPDVIEEIVVKPIVWLIPLFWLTAKERFSIATLGITLKNLFPALYLSLGLGAIFVVEAVLANVLKYGHLSFAANIGDLPIISSLAISFATAFSEEISFRGYIFGKLWYVTENEWVANIISTLIWTSIHIPIAFFIWKLDFASGFIYLFLTAIFGLGSSFIFARTKNIFGSIFLHVLWEWPIILFR